MKRQFSNQGNIGQGNPVPSPQLFADSGATSVDESSSGVEDLASLLDSDSPFSQTDLAIFAAGKLLKYFHSLIYFYL